VGSTPTGVSDRSTAGSDYIICRLQENVAVIAMSPEIGDHREFPPLGSGRYWRIGRGFLVAGGTVKHVKYAVLGQQDDFTAAVAVHVSGRHAGTVMPGQPIVFTLYADDDVRLFNPQPSAAVVVDGKMAWHGDEEVLPSVVVDVGDVQAISTTSQNKSSPSNFRSHAGTSPDYSWNCPR
jgi:hypothetical protein